MAILNDVPRASHCDPLLLTSVGGLDQFYVSVGQVSRQW